MKLLILTQKMDINDDVLGFFHDWVLEFAKHCEKVTVICLEKAKYELPENVRVLSLGKEGLKNPPFSPFVKRGNKILYGLRFYKYIWQERKNYDAVFVHMNPEYAVMGGLFWRVWHKKIGLWYVHKNVDLKLRLAEKMATTIFTVSKESFQLLSRKLKILGHGINLNKFKACPEPAGWIQNPNFKMEENIFKIIYVGRISPIKNQKLLVEAIDILINREKVENIKVDFVGRPIYAADIKYQNELRALVEEKKLTRYVHFVGSVSHEDICRVYNNADLSVNLCPTGGIDKAVLESMACGCLALVVNESFRNILPSEMISDAKFEMLANKIKFLMLMPALDKEEMQRRLSNEVAERHDLKILINKICEYL